MTFSFMSNPSTGNKFLVVGTSPQVRVGVRPTLTISGQQVGIGFRIRMELREEATVPDDLEGWVKENFPKFLITGGDGKTYVSSACQITTPPALAVGPYSTLGFWIMNNLSHHVWLSIGERTGVSQYIPYTDFKAWFEGTLTDHLREVSDVIAPVDNVFAVDPTPTNP